MDAEHIQQIRKRTAVSFLVDLADLAVDDRAFHRIDQDGTELASKFANRFQAGAFQVGGAFDDQNKLTFTSVGDHLRRREILIAFVGEKGFDLEFRFLGVHQLAPHAGNDRSAAERPTGQLVERGRKAGKSVADDDDLHVEENHVFRCPHFDVQAASMTDVLDRVPNIAKTVGPDTGFVHDTEKILRKNKREPAVHSCNPLDEILNTGHGKFGLQVVAGK